MSLLLFLRLLIKLADPGILVFVRRLLPGRLGSFLIEEENRAFYRGEKRGFQRKAFRFAFSLASKG